MGFISSLVADVRGRGATGFQVKIELPAKSRLRDHFLVAWIVSQLARAESCEGAAPPFRTVSSELPRYCLFGFPDFMVDFHPEIVCTRNLYLHIGK